MLWHAGSADEEREYLPVLTNAFSSLGYIEGKNIKFEHRFPAERPDRLATELIESKVDVIVAVTANGAKEIKQAKSAIPTVFVIVADPVGSGFLESLAHPGDNMTGLSLMSADMSGKRLALLKETVSNLSRVALLFDPTSRNLPLYISLYANAAKALGLFLQPVEVPTPDTIEDVFSAIARDGFDGAEVDGSMMFNERVRVGSSALAHKMPTITFIAEMVQYGLLMSYGQDFPDYFRKAAGYVDKILRGAKPGDLPVEQPTRFKQVINLKGTSKNSGLPEFVRV